jgi:hypothetical protein
MMFAPVIPLRVRYLSAYPRAFAPFAFYPGLSPFHRPVMNSLSPPGTVSLFQLLLSMTLNILFYMCCTQISESTVAREWRTGMLVL